MALLVAVFPGISAEDHHWIQAYREENDSLFTIVQPHFTIVFPVNDIEQTAFINEIRHLAKDQPAISFEITNTVVRKDDFRDHYHEFLIPCKGNKEIIELHDRLYAGLLQPHLRADLEYVPHISIGNSASREICERRLNNVKIKPFKGRISELTILAYENNVVSELSRISLVS